MKLKWILIVVVAVLVIGQVFHSAIGGNGFWLFNLFKAKQTTPQPLGLNTTEGLPPGAMNLR